MAQKCKEKYALLIGPTYSPDLEPKICCPLPGVKNDIEKMKNMLTRRKFQSENIKVLEGDEASKQNILNSLEELSSIAPRESVVIIYFSGHGYKLKEEFDEGLVPSCLTKEMISEYRINEQCITGKDFAVHLEELMDKQCVVNTIFDCCFSGRLYRGISMEKEGYHPIPKQLKLSKDYVESYCEELKSRVQSVKHVEYVNPASSIAVKESLSVEKAATPHQEKQHPNPTQQSGLSLSHPKPERSTSNEWVPSQNDKFIHIAACESNEKAYEEPAPLNSGRLTSVLVEILNEDPTINKDINYNILKSLIKQKFADKYYRSQTPQFEGGNMEMVVFDFFRTVSEPTAFEICEVTRKNEYTEVILDAGKLQGVVDGQYDVYGPHITDDEVHSKATSGSAIDQIEVMAENIDMISSRGKVINGNNAGEIKVGCKAVLRRRRSLCTSVCVKFPDSQMDQDHKYKLKQEIKKIKDQGMFVLEEKETEHTVTLDVQVLNGKNCWRACQYGRMIVPHQQFGDEGFMMQNLSKYFRYKFAIGLQCPNSNMLKNVKFEGFKIENVPSFKGPKSKDKKKELIHKATETANLFGDIPADKVPTFRAHKVEAAFHSEKRMTYKILDETGDALVIRITNNEMIPIHVCVMSCQADGSIVVVHPPRDGYTEVLDPGESAEAIKRIFVEPNTVRRMAEPDFVKPEPNSCDDILMMYATGCGANYKALIQTAIELSKENRGPNPPDGKRLRTVNEFRDALQPPGSSTTQSCRDCAKDKWLTIRQNIKILCNDDQEAEKKGAGTKEDAERRF